MIPSQGADNVFSVCHGFVPLISIPFHHKQPPPKSDGFKPDTWEKSKLARQPVAIVTVKKPPNPNNRETL
jgi:hypothetical protein